MFLKCYFIVAPNFHGATILGKLLNDHPEVINLGDTYPSNRIDQVCGCGEQVSQCTFWQQVGSDIGVDRYRSHRHWLPNYPDILGGIVCCIARSPLPARQDDLEVRQKTFVADFMAFMRAFHTYGRRPDARVFVDGMKSISRVFALAACGVPIDGVIHLLRNPGDYIQSTMKQHGYCRRAFVPRLVNYRFFHNRARRIGREFLCLSLTYEELVEKLEVVLDRLFRFLGVEPRPLSELVAEGQKRPWHFMGNASLFHFDGIIRPSLHVQTWTERAVTMILSGPYYAHSLRFAGTRF